MSFAIYERPSKYVVKHFDEAEPNLWCRLGENYTRDMAQSLADSLTRDRERNKDDEKRRRFAERYKTTPEAIELAFGPRKERDANVRRDGNVQENQVNLLPRDE